MPKKSSKADQNIRDNKQGRLARRRLIQTLALGGGIASAKLIPASWTAPVVETAVLPAHAAGSAECTLGNTRPLPPEQVVEAAGPGPVLDVVEQVFNTAVPDALAGAEGDGQSRDTALFLTGCYRITFLCNSNEGRLYASATTGEADLDSGDTTLEAHFFFDQLTPLEGDFCFRVTKQNGGTSAQLWIGFCENLDGPFVLDDPNPICAPCELVFEDGPELVCATDDS